MQVVKAKNAGACYGVRRALELAQKAVVYHDEVHTLGELIHNPRAVEELQQSGVCVATSIDEVDSGVILIRSHGVAPQIFDDIAAKGLEVIDATCPHVLRAQKAAAELARAGCHVVIVGEEGHPEVEGIKAHALQAQGTVTVARNPSEIPCELCTPVGVVVQTTQRQENLQQILDELEHRGIYPKVRNTICSATQKRQEEARNLARKADVMIVIGGRNSSNTTRLAQICHEECNRTYHVESSEEIESLMLKDADIVGITAGASTPELQLDEVVSRIKEIGQMLDKNAQSTHGSTL